MPTPIRFERIKASANTDEVFIIFRNSSVKQMLEMQKALIEHLGLAGEVEVNVENYGDGLCRIYTTVTTNTITDAVVKRLKVLAGRYRWKTRLARARQERWKPNQIGIS